MFGDDDTVSSNEINDNNSISSSNSEKDIFSSINIIDINAAWENYEDTDDPSVHFSSDNIHNTNNNFSTLVLLYGGWKIRVFTRSKPY